MNVNFGHSQLFFGICDKISLSLYFFLFLHKNHSKTFHLLATSSNLGLSHFFPFSKLLEGEVYIWDFSLLSGTYLSLASCYLASSLFSSLPLEFIGVGTVNSASFLITVSLYCSIALLFPDPNKCLSRLYP